LLLADAVKLIPDRKIRELLDKGNILVCETTNMSE